MSIYNVYLISNSYRQDGDYTMYPVRRISVKYSVIIVPFVCTSSSYLALSVYMQTCIRDVYIPLQMMN